MDELEFALETIDGGAFEDFAMAFLREEGYKVHESGGTGPDGGWDARIEMGSKHGIAHASKRNDWRRKLREDAKKVKNLEDERSEDYDLFVFVTNQSVQGDHELEMEDEIREEYGWTLRIHHRDNILGELRQNKQQLANDYLDVNLESERDHVEEVEELRDDRLELIQKRVGIANDLVEGPAVALHIIPNGIFSKDKVRSSSAIPEPPVLYDLHPYSETRGKSTVSYGRGSHGRGGPEDGYESYAIYRNDGLYESVTTSAILDRYEDELWIRGFIERSGGIGLDAYTVLAARDVMSDLAEMNFSGSAFVFLSFLDANNLQLHSPDLRRRGSYYEPPALGADLYSTDFGILQIGSEEVIKGLEPVLSEVWRQFGHEDGTVNIKDGEWAGGTFNHNHETLLEKGHK